MARATKARARVTWNFTVAERIDERSSSAAGIIARLPSDALTRKVAATEFGETFGNRAPQVVYRFLNPLGFAAGQLAVFQGASDEHI